MQHELEVSTKQAIFVDSSISDTIRTCIVLGNHRAAMKVKTEFKVCTLHAFLPTEWALESVSRVKGFDLHQELYLQGSRYDNCHILHQ